MERDDDSTWVEIQRLDAPGVERVCVPVSKLPLAATPANWGDAIKAIQVGVERMAAAWQAELGEIRRELQLIREEMGRGADEVSRRLDDSDCRQRMAGHPLRLADEASEPRR